MSSQSSPRASPIDLPARPSVARVLLGRFELVTRLGSGASGTVFEAIDRERDARVALKVLNARGGDPLVRFKREFRALQAVRHPNVVGFGELFSDGDEWFFTMDLLHGTDFRGYVRRGAGFDEARLRDCVRQIADALATLHGVGIVHRDVKPANVVVSGQGRATLLDFGVVRDDSNAPSSAANVISFVGTPAYMAPEQIAGDAGPPADCYALGVMLFDALVGQLPFGGKVAEVLEAKKSGEPPAPHEIDPRVPRELSQLAKDLLAIDPSSRPCAADVALRVMPHRRMTSSIPAAERAATFVGRARELSAMWSAWLAVRDGRPASLVLEGESGIGKSSLAQHFLAQVRARDPRALVLASRCRENEWIPYKAFDGLVDALSRFMRTCSDVEAALLLPMRAALVAQVFPALMQVSSVGVSAPLHAGDADAVLERRRLFAAVRELFARAAERYPLVVFVDDVQWADPDSLALLAEVIEGADAAPMLLVVAARPAHVRERDPIPPCLRAAPRVTLGPLSPGDAEELARGLAPGVSLDARALAEESEGHPLFLQELVCHATRALVVRPRASPRLDDALDARVSALDPAAKEVLEHVAVASRPMTRAVIARATSLEGHDAQRILRDLAAANLVRTSGPQAERVEPFHDRVRQAVLRALPGPRRVKRHRRIAAALESLDRRDADALAYHWHEAGRADRAAAYAEQAAEDALRAFAWGEAARLYRLALDRAVQPPERRAQILAKLGEARALAGESDDAAAAYGEAASLVTGADAVALRQKAADQLFRAGRVREGLALAHRVLAELGMCAPRGALHALVTFVFWRCMLALRGAWFRERTAAEVAPRELARIDVSWSMTSALSTVDPIAGAYFQVHHLRMALAAGEPYRVLRALALQTSYAAGPGRVPFARTERAAARCAALATKVGDRHGVALARLTEGIACYLHGRFARSLALLDEAEERLLGCPGTWGEIARARRFAIGSLANLGRMGELAKRVRAQLADARDRGDAHATTDLRIGHGSLAWLAADDLSGARREIADAMRAWSLPGFQVEHVYELMASCNADLYAGEPDLARARLLAAWPRLERSRLLRIAAVRLLVATLRARAALALAARGAPSWLLREAEIWARRVARVRALPYAPAVGELLFAGVASCRGEASRACEHAARAEVEFDRSDMRLHAMVARRARGLTAEADAWMRSEGIVRPDRIAAMYAPHVAREDRQDAEPPRDG